MNAYFLSLKRETPNNDYWDYGMMTDLIKGKLWRPPHFPDITIKEVSKLPKDNTAIVVIPARHHADLAEEVNNQLQNIDKVILFLMGDEEADFPVEKITHQDIHIWVQNPHPGVHDEYNKIGTGYPGHIHDYVGYRQKVLNLYFAGQITHARREELSRNLDVLKDTNIRVVETKGFTQGEPKEDYYKHMSEAKIVPAPSGAVIPDSFRLFEALEMMAVPIADEVNPPGTITQYWDWLFGEISPFPRVNDWDVLQSLEPDILNEWPYNMFTITAWWIAYKRKLAYKLRDQING